MSKSGSKTKQKWQSRPNPMLKISLSSISKLEVRNLKRKLNSELDQVRGLIKRSHDKKGTLQVFNKCNTLLTKLMKHKSAWVFNVPVDAKGLGLHDYHTIVKEPMDLGTVKAKLGKSLYMSPLDFAQDVRLTFNNAILYNPLHHEVHRIAQHLLSIFEEKWVSIETHFHSKTPNKTFVESMTTPVQLQTLVTAAPVDFRDLTLDEKRRLSEELQDLPYDKLETVVQIIKKRNPELSQQDDEIELDIDSVDIQTLWELYNFVTGHKDNKEDHGFGSQRDAESVHSIIQEPTTLAIGADISRVTESGKAIRTLSPGILRENNASSSNSSSSDSGSGSSDSESGSSSGRGSDTGI